MGISPYRYRDLSFTRANAKNQTEKARDWYLTDMRPMVDMVVLPIPKMRLGLWPTC